MIDYQMQSIDMCVFVSIIFFFILITKMSKRATSSNMQVHRTDNETFVNKVGVCMSIHQIVVFEIRNIKSEIF